jgi:hypothetical protein
VIYSHEKRGKGAIEMNRPLYLSHDEVNKAPTWCYDFAKVVQQLDKKLWVTNLDGREPKSKIIAFLRTSVLTKADKDRLSNMRESKMSEEDCDSMSSEDGNYFD